MVALSELNAYSAMFAERLLATHPEWSALAERDPEGFPPPGSLLLEVQSPVSDRKLVIRTYGDQVTIDFGPHGWHDHFDVGASLAFIDDLMSDRVVIATRFLFGMRAWSRPVAADARPPRFGQLEVYSWTGKHDVR